MKLKDKIIEISNNRELYFCGMQWEVRDSDIIDLYDYSEDVWNDKVKPIFSSAFSAIDINDKKLDVEFNRYMIYKPNELEFSTEKFSSTIHIAFILNKEEQTDTSINMRTLFK